MGGNVDDPLDYPVDLPVVISIKRATGEFS